MDLITPTKKVVTLARIKVFVVRVPDHKDFIQNLVGAKTLEFSEKFKVSVPLKIAYVSLWSGTWTTKTLVALARIKVSVGGITLTHSGPGIPVFFSFALLCLWLRSGRLAKKSSHDFQGVAMSPPTTFGKINRCSYPTEIAIFLGVLYPHPAIQLQSVCMCLATCIPRLLVITVLSTGVSLDWIKICRRTCFTICESLYIFGL